MSSGPLSNRRPACPSSALAGLSMVLLLLSGCGDGSTAPTESPGPGLPGLPDPGAYDHARGPGASARDLLSDEAYDSLVVQVSYVDGFRPTDEALDRLVDFLGEYLEKPRGIGVEIQAPVQISAQTYSLADIRALEEQHRTAYTEGRTLAVHFLFVDGAYSESANVLGVAYANTSMVIFEEQIRDHSGGPLEPTEATVEAVVAQHEFGHILGLVNNGSPMQTDHQDEPNGRHCDDPDCLMYYAVRTTDFISNLLGGAPTLDQDCIDDLRANQG